MGLRTSAVAVVAASLAVGTAGAAPPAPARGTLAFGTGTFVFAVHANGSGGRALGPGDYPAFSRSGGALAFTLDGVWTAGAGGAHRRRLVPRFAEYLTYTDPAWSPDGTRIAYIRIDNGHETAELWVVREDGSHLHGLSIVHAAESPSWSPDGRWIAYAGDGGLSEVRADGSGKRLLLRRTVVSPVWSPGGRWIAFEQETGGTVSIRLYAARTGAVRVLERHPGPAGPLAWAPDGSRLAYATEHAQAGGVEVDLRIVRISDGRTRRVTRTFAQHLDGLTWRG
jgi:WD40 repeat protein